MYQCETCGRTLWSEEQAETHEYGDGRGYWHSVSRPED